jgi:hypothetical protein
MSTSLHALTRRNHRFETLAEVASGNVGLRFRLLPRAGRLPVLVLSEQFNDPEVPEVARWHLRRLEQFSARL